MTLKSLVCSCVLILAPYVVSAAPSAVVGPLAAPSRLHIKGVKSFSAAQVKRALLSDLEVITSGAPSSSRLNYIDTLKRRLKAGFMIAGFIDCQVVAQPSFSADELTLEVTEGARYHAGPVIISGITEALQTRMTSTAQYQSFIKEHWREGEPVAYQHPTPQS